MPNVRLRNTKCESQLDCFKVQLAHIQVAFLLSVRTVNQSEFQTGKAQCTHIFATWLCLFYFILQWYHVENVYDYLVNIAFCSQRLINVFLIYFSNSMFPFTWCIGPCPWAGNLSVHVKCGLLRIVNVVKWCDKHVNVTQNFYKGVQLGWIISFSSGWC